MSPRPKGASAPSRASAESLRDRLEAAACEGDLRALRALRSKGATPDGATLVAALTPRSLRDDLATTLATLDALVGDGLTVNTPDRDGDTLVLCSASRGDIELLDALFARGAKATDAAVIAALDEPRARTMIHPSTRAKHHRHVAVALRLLAAGASHDVLGPQGESLLHYGVLRDSVELVELALAKGITPQNTGRTAIAYVDENSAPGIFEALMAAGADPDARGDFGAPLLWHLAGSGGEPAGLAMIDALLAAGASVHATPDDPKRTHLHGMTPLHAATWQSVAEPDAQRMIVQKLLASGADANARDASGTTPTQYAQRSDRVELVRLLGAPAAPPTLASLGLAMNSETFRTALRDGQTVVLDLLVDGGYIATLDDLWGVILGGHAPLLRRLLANGAPVDDYLIQHAVTCREFAMATMLHAAAKEALPEREPQGKKEKPATKKRTAKKRW